MQFTNVVLDVLQGHAVALIRGQPGALDAALKDIRHMCHLRWEPKHADLLGSSLEGLCESIAETSAAGPPPTLAPIEHRPLSEAPCTVIEVYEAVVKDDVASLMYAFAAGVASLDTALDKTPTTHPFVRGGDTLVSVAERYGSTWCQRFLEWSAANIAATPASKRLQTPQPKRLSGLAQVRRRGSYSVMKIDFAKRKDAQQMQLMIHLPDDSRVVSHSTSGEKKARHVVYDLAEAYQLDLEAFALQRKLGESEPPRWLDDYKSLRVNGVRSGDELFVVLKHRALHQQKNFRLRVIVLHSGGLQREFVCAIDPFTLIGTLRKIVAARMACADDGMSLLIPIVLDGASTMAGVFLDDERTFSSYGLADASHWIDATTGNTVTKPLLMGLRDVLRVQPPLAHVRETDQRMATWMEIVLNWSVYHSTRRSDLLAALLLGVPGCLRGRVWELLLFSKPFAKLDKTGFADLVDTDAHTENAERTLEQIGNDVDRTMPYHPSFRDKGGYGQTNLHRVLRAYAAYDPELGQGMNFITATLLGPLSPDAAFWALTLLMSRYHLRSNFTSGMTGLHSMLGKFEDLLQSEMPALREWMLSESLISASFASEWQVGAGRAILAPIVTPQRRFLTLFSAQSVDAAYRIWDVFLLEGTPFLFKVAMSLLALKQSEMRARPEEAMETIKAMNVDLTQLLARAAAIRFNK